jgi:hypothetical protein
MFLQQLEEILAMAAGNMEHMPGSFPEEEGDESDSQDD